MKEKIYENGIEYILVGDYYLPNIVLPHEKRHIGKCGMFHRDYINTIHGFMIGFKVKVNCAIIFKKLA